MKDAFSTTDFKVGLISPAHLGLGEKDTNTGLPTQFQSFRFERKRKRREVEKRKERMEFEEKRKKVQEGKKIKS